MHQHLLKVLKQVGLVVHSFKIFKHNITEGDIMLFLMIIKIFFARIIDVSLGTFRTILTVKGKIYFPTIIAFFEVIVWFYVAKEALLVDTNNILIPISYSLGYATGNLIGSLISKYVINIYYEVKVYYFNNKVINYLRKLKVRYYIVENKDRNKLLITYISKKTLNERITKIHKLAKRSIIYTNEARKYKSILTENNFLQTENNML